MNSLINNNVTLGGAQTILGYKKFDNFVIVERNGDTIYSDSPDIVLNTAPATDKNINSYVGRDKNDDWAVAIQGIFHTDNTVENALRVRRPDKSSSTRISVTASNSGYETFAPPVSNVNGIVTQSAISKGANGYLKFGNTIMLQWGASGAAASGTVTLPTPYSSTNYRISTAVSVNVNEPRVIGVYDKTSTNFKYICYRQSGSGATSTATAFDYITLGV